MNDLHLLLFLGAILIPLVAQLYLMMIFKKAKGTQASLGLPGKEVARKILAHYSVEGVPIELSPGRLSDHYDPIRKKLGLSGDVYDKGSVAAMAIAAHEVGHAIQDKVRYRYLVFRTVSYPLIGFASRVAPFLILAGLFFTGLEQLLLVGIGLFGLSVVFTLITLPVEFDASRRALIAVREMGLASPSEYPMVKQVLTAAALTYVAAAITAIMEMVRLILIYRERS